MVQEGNDAEENQYTSQVQTETSYSLQHWIIFNKPKLIEVGVDLSPKTFNQHVREKINFSVRQRRFQVKFEELNGTV